MSHVVAIIEARMGASRLPGKTLMDVSGKTLLERVIDRLSLSKAVDTIVVATTTATRDDAVVDLCAKKSILFFRGSEKDVLERVYQTAKKYEADIIIQSGGDCPFYDPILVDILVSVLKFGGYAYAANDMTLTFPEGIDAHVMRFDALQTSAKEATNARERDDTPRFIWNNSERFPIFNMEAAPHSPLNRPEIRLTVDYPEDLSLAQKIYKEFGQRNLAFTSIELIDFLNANLDLIKINNHCKQQSGAYIHD